MDLLTILDYLCVSHPTEKWVQRETVNLRIEVLYLEVELKSQVLHVSGASYFILVFDKISF